MESRETHDEISIHALRKESDARTPGRRNQDARFQSTLSVRRATFLLGKRIPLGVISIHALRKESDVVTGQQYKSLIGISIHALRKESDPNWENGKSPHDTFQSTLSVRRATNAAKPENQPVHISIHALRKESDSPPSPNMSSGIDFNPRSP